MLECMTHTWHKVVLELLTRDKVPWYDLTKAFYPKINTNVRDVTAIRLLSTTKWDGLNIFMFLEAG